MSEDRETLAELMLHADQFCSKVEHATKDVAPTPEEKELHAKIGQCRTQLAYLQEAFNDGKLTHREPRTATNFRVFRMLVRIEAGFTYFLVNR
jgi:hypothetical protein